MDVHKRVAFFQWLSLIFCSAFAIERALNGTWVGIVLAATMALANLVGIVAMKMQKSAAASAHQNGRRER